MGNRIVGVFINGASGSDVPDAFNKYGNALVGWNSKCAIEAIEGKNNTWEKPDGSPWENKWDTYRSEC